MGNPFEKIKSKEPSIEKEEGPEIEKSRVREYVDGLKDLANEKQQKLNQLLAMSQKERDDSKIQTLKQELSEIDEQVVEMKETLEFMEEAGDELEIEVKDLE